MLLLAGCGTSMPLPVYEPTQGDRQFDELREVLFPPAEYGAGFSQFIGALRARYLGRSSEYTYDEMSHLAERAKSIQGAGAGVEYYAGSVLFTFGVTAPDMVISWLIWFRIDDGLIKGVAIDFYNQPLPTCHEVQPEEKAAEPGATGNLGYTRRFREGFRIRSHPARCLSFIVGQGRKRFTLTTVCIIRMIGILSVASIAAGCAHRPADVDMELFEAWFISTKLEHPDPPPSRFLNWEDANSQGFAVRRWFGSISGMRSPARSPHPTRLPM